MDKKTNLTNSSIYGCSDMKRSESEFEFSALQEFFSFEDCKKLTHQKDGFFQDSSTLEDGNHHLLPLPFNNSEIHKGFPMSNCLADDQFWSQNLYPKHFNSSAPIDSQSSICVDSPISVNNSKGSSHEQSDEDEQEIEAGPCEQSTKPAEIKRMNRMKSNRDSARRSRQRKQAYLAELEQQVELLRGENESLFKQLAEATQQCKDSTTNNRVLRSDVEALRAKVKLAEDMVARGSLTSSLSHLLTNYLNTSHDYVNNTNNNSMSHIDHNISPIMVPRVDDNNNNNNSPFSSVPESNIKLENTDAFNGNAMNVIVPGIWNWESNIGPRPK